MYLIFIIFILLSLSVSYLVSGAETAYFSLRRNDLEDFKNSGKKTAKIVLALLTKPKKLLATILVVNNLCNIATVILTTILTWEFFGKDNYIIFLMTILLTFVIVLVGEIIPKIWAKNNNIGFAQGSAPILKLLFTLTSPLSSLLVSTNSKLDTILGKRQANKEQVKSIVQAVKYVAENKESSATVQDLWLKQAAIFGTKTVSDIMRYRLHVKGLELETSFEEVLNCVRRWGYSRIPIYRKSLDHIHGILYAKDILKYSDEGKNFRWQALLRTDPMFVSPNKNINDLLKKFQLKKTHIAIVVDEFGATEGLVTMPDILEEIVGQTGAEFEHIDETDFYTKVDDRTFIFESYTSLNDFCKILDLSDHVFDSVNPEVESLAGLILEIKASLPKKGEQIKHEGFLFTIQEADTKKIGRIKVEIMNSI